MPLRAGLDRRFHSKSIKFHTYKVPMGLRIVKQVVAAAKARKGSRARRHYEWRQKQQDILVVFTGTVVREVASAVRQVARNRGRFGVAKLGRIERLTDLPPGHPPMPGIEHVKPVIMTVKFHCSMAQVVDLIKYDMPEDLSVVPIPSERCNIW